MKQEAATTDELMNNLTINAEVQSGTKSTPHRSHLSLSKLPFEIKENIVYWLTEIASEDENFIDDGSDIEEVDDQEFTDQIGPNYKPDRKCDSNSTSLFVTKPSSSDPTSPNKDIESDQKDRPNTDPILALSMVDRTFYELCRPVIWKNVDCEHYNLTKLRQFRSQILVRQAEYVRSLWWRTSKSELAEYEPRGWKRETEEREWDPYLRSNELLGVLESCTKVTHLDIDLFCPLNHLIQDEGTLDPEDFITWKKYIYPISQLTNLTSISLTAASELPFQESFLVRLIRDMNNLDSFGCCMVFPDSADLETSNSVSNCKSPLGIHLASLSTLKTLDLNQVGCFDLSWSTIEWQGKLSTIIIDDCPRATLRTIHEFCNKFSTSLINLELEDVPSDQSDEEKMQSQINSGKYRFELPKLKALSVTNELPINFLRLFEDSKNIKEINLEINLEHTAQDIENIVKVNGGVGFTNLKKLYISLGVDSELSMGEREALELFYLSKGVAFEIESDTDDDESDDIEDDDESDNGVDSVDYQLEVGLDDEWDEEEDDELDDEDFD